MTMHVGKSLRCTLAAILLAAGLAAGQGSSNIAETIIVLGDPCRPGESFPYQRTLREKTALQTRFDVQFPSPVAMRSNLHNAIFMPETRDMWVSDAGRKTPACDEPYVKVNLIHLLEIYAADKLRRP